MEKHREEDGFRIVDRRRVRPDGEPAAGSGSPEVTGPAEAPRASEPEPEHPQAERHGEPATLPPPGFATLVDSLALNVIAALGLAAEQREGGAPSRPDLPLARHGIDLLGMLEEKTRGNLTPDEARLLEQALFELRMLFVRASSRPR